MPIETALPRLVAAGDASPRGTNLVLTTYERASE